jgi:hypothetical protein
MPVASTMPASAVEVGETSMRMMLAAGDADKIFFGHSRTCAILRRVWRLTLPKPAAHAAA